MLLPNPATAGPSVSWGGSARRKAGCTGEWKDRHPRGCCRTTLRGPGPRSVRAPGLDLLDDITGDLAQLAVGGPGLRGQHVEGGVGTDPVPTHEDAFGLVDDGPG